MIANPVFEIDLNSLRSNYLYMQGMVGAGTQVAAVVKSDAYGLGLAQISRTLHAAGCSLFFVANLEEALDMRSSGVSAAIAVFGGSPAQYLRIYRSAGLIFVASQRSDLDAISSAGNTYRYFLNIDTGFGRFGFDHDQSYTIKKHRSLEATPPCCVLSHLACSDDARSPANRIQRDRFIAAASSFPNSYRSLSASAGVWLGQAYHFDIVRVGSALYGLNNARVHPNPLHSVVRLRAPLVETRHVPANQDIGYGATFRTMRKTHLGIIGIGYRHGLPWSCANRINVRIGTYLAPVVGRISMEYTTVDLTDVPECELTQGMLVDFLYDDFGVDELACAAGANSQELLLRLGASCPRSYSDPLPQQVQMTGGLSDLKRATSLQVSRLAPHQSAQRQRSLS